MMHRAEALSATSGPSNRPSIRAERIVPSTSNLMKTVIVGNSGSGKTWLAAKLAATTEVPVVHLDELFWQPGGFDQKKKPTETASLIESARRDSGWVVEGVFGELAAEFLVDADVLVWLDLDWAICEARLLARGSESKAHMARTQSEAGLVKLLDWASTYRSRDDARSFSGHFALFKAFDGPKARLWSEGDVDALLAAARREGLVEATRTLGRLHAGS
jgi:adenylate kinase family enzyme